jgi:transposase
MMCTIGLDLSVAGAHRGVIMDDTGKFRAPLFKVSTRSEELAAMLMRARQEAGSGGAVTVVMEPTGYAWFPVAAYLLRQPDVTVYLVNSQQVADLRRYYKKHAKSDRIDARVLAKLPLISPEKLHALRPASAETFALQRACKQLDWAARQISALKNQVIALDRLVWLGGWEKLVFEAPFGVAARWCRDHYYDPTAVLKAGAEAIRRAWQAANPGSGASASWVTPLVELAGQAVAIYGPSTPFVDFAALLDEIRLKQKWLRQLESAHKHLQLKEVRPRYRRLHPSRNLETIKGVGQDSAAVFFSFIGDPDRFANGRCFRGWSGMVPCSAQSANAESKGLRISKAGPDLIKKYAFLDAEIARRWDPQLAKIYYDQMVHRGKHHTQAVCAVATHLLDRILVILKEDRPYQLRDVGGAPVTGKEARRIIAEKYTVPEDVRRRNNRRVRQQRADHKAERAYTRQKRREGRLTVR